MNILNLGAHLLSWACLAVMDVPGDPWAVSDPGSDLCSQPDLGLPSLSSEMTLGAIQP